MAAAFLTIFLLLSFTVSFSTCSAQISRKELRSKEVNQEVVLQLGHSVHSGRVNPSRVVQVSWQPRVFVYQGFLSEEECDHLISLARRKKEGTTQLSKNSEATLNVNDEVVASVEERISAWTLLPQENSMSLQLVRYGEEDAKQKFDFFGNRSALGVSEPLMATIVLYLSDVSRGGEISFPDSQLKTSGLKSKVWPYSNRHSNLLKPVKGNAVLFFSIHPNASPDKSSRHDRNPVLQGEMWCGTKLFHLRPVGGRRISLQNESNDCTDEDDNCPQWASVGECQRNPIFMIGSPDYYGTCRKSCKAC